MCESSHLSVAGYTAVLHLLGVEVQVQQLLQVGLLIGTDQDTADMRGVVTGQACGCGHLYHTFWVIGEQNRSLLHSLW